MRTKQEGVFERDLCILVELVCRDVVNGEHNFDVVLFGFLNQTGDFFGTWLVKQGVADLELR